MKKITLFIIMVFAAFYLNAQQNKTIIKKSMKHEDLAIKRLKEAHDNQTKTQFLESYKKIKENYIKKTEKTKETSSCSTQDSLALVKIYNNMNGTNWTHQENWLSDAPVKDWWGITVENNRVTSIDFFWDWDSTQNMAGEIVDEFWDLTALEVIDLSVNQISGSISPKIENHTNLTVLKLNTNNLEESIPNELGNLTKLQIVNMGNNQLTGPIPPELENLADLQILSIYSNQLSGPIPSELGNLANLQKLELYYNQLEGPIPTELGNLDNLLLMDLFGNELTDSIPKELGDLFNLQIIDLGANELTGHIPKKIANLTNLEYLSLRSNQLTGSIPPELGNLSNLKRLFLGVNQLTGPIPPELGSLTNLDYLYLTFNQLTGTIPSELGGLQNLKWCYFNYNLLEGSVPAEIGNINCLQQFDIYNNNLDGLPDFSNLNNLGIFRVYNNYLSFGDLEKTNIDMEASQYYVYAPQNTILPLAIDTTANTVKLSVLTESSTNNYQWIKDDIPLNTETDSTISYELTDTSSYYCIITNNNYPNLTLKTNAVGCNLKNGIIKSDYNVLVTLYNSTDGDNWQDNSNWLSNEPVSNWHGITVEGSRVTRINFNNNSLSGTLPAEIGNLDSLEQLYINHNNGITGSIPSEIGNLKALKALAIVDEQLTGPIPATMNNLINLETIYLYENKLEKFSDLSNLVNLRHFYIRNNLFTFGDLETANINWDALSGYNYAPQDLLLPLEIDTANNITLSVLAESPNNNYQWMKDGNPLSGETDSILTYKTTDKSTYHCEVTNNNFPALTLNTESHKNIAYEITFKIINESLNPIESAIVNIDSEGENTTDTNGETVFNLSNGDYSYTVNADGYDNIEGNFSVEGDRLTEEVILTESTYILTFKITNEQDAPIERATVNIDGISEQTTDNSGESIFDLPNDNYAYTITAEEYVEISGNITIEGSDINENVTLSAISTNIKSVRGTLTEVYPNPAFGQITIESDTQINATKLINLMGKVVISEHPEEKKITIDISNLNSGIYLLKIIHINGQTETKRVMIW